MLVFYSLTLIQINKTAEFIFSLSHLFADPFPWLITINSKPLLDTVSCQWSVAIPSNVTAKSLKVSIRPDFWIKDVVTTLKADECQFLKSIQFFNPTSVFELTTRPLSDPGSLHQNQIMFKLCSCM